MLNSKELITLKDKHPGFAESNLKIEQLNLSLKYGNNVHSINGQNDIFKQCSSEVSVFYQFEFLQQMSVLKFRADLKNSKSGSESTSHNEGIE